MAETTANPIETLVAEARERLKQEIGAQAEQIQNLEKSFQELRDRQKKFQEEIDQQIGQLAGQSLQQLRERHTKLEETIQQQLDQLGKFEPPPPPPPAAPPPALPAAMDKLLNSVRNLITATLPEQVMDVLTEEAEQMGVRAAVFDVRGKSAWGSSARGFGSALSAKAFRGLVVPLNQDNPFRQAFETGGHVDVNYDGLKRNRNIIDKLKPTKDDTILLQPIRSAGSVSAIFYTDTGGKDTPLPVDAIKILSEFAGAQLDRLMALGGGGAPAEVDEEEAAPVEEERGEEVVAVPEPAVIEAPPPPPPAREEPVEAVTPPPPPPPPAIEEMAPPAPDTPPVAPPQPPPSPVGAPQLTDEEQKFQKDAKRFARLLVSEIDLYNKTKVADGRKNKDLYKRLKSDIERSRQTFQKRFSKPIGPPTDFFHEELIRTLANNDPALMGPEYPGPAA